VLLAAALIRLIFPERYIRIYQYFPFRLRQRQFHEIKIRRAGNVMQTAEKKRNFVCAKFRKLFSSVFSSTTTSAAAANSCTLMRKNMLKLITITKLPHNFESKWNWSEMKDLRNVVFVVFKQQQKQHQLLLQQSNGM